MSVCRPIRWLRTANVSDNSKDRIRRTRGFSLEKAFFARLNALADMAERETKSRDSHDINQSYHLFRSARHLYTRGLYAFSSTPF